MTVASPAPPVVLPSDWTGLISEPAALDRAAFVVVGMYTRTYAEKAARLAESCNRLGLAHCLREIPAIHCSISPKGTAEAVQFTKPRIIMDCLDTLQKPVLYIDADCVIRTRPDIAHLLDQSIDFAIYNWLADARNDAYVPASIPITSEAGTVVHENRFLQFSHRIPYLAPDQLICSGAVQFYAYTAAAQVLLQHWHDTIIAFSIVYDDWCLDFTFNNFSSDIPGLRCGWLPRSHCRYVWWFYTPPVIDHPEFPTTLPPVPFVDPQGRKRVYEERIPKFPTEPLFPAGTLVDTAERLLVRIDNDVMHAIGRLPDDMPVCL